MLRRHQSCANFSVPDQARRCDDERVEIITFRGRVKHVPRVSDVGDGFFDREKFVSSDAVLGAVLPYRAISAETRAFTRLASLH